MIRKDNPALAFLSAILLASVIISPYALDLCLSARFLVMSAGIATVIILWYRSWSSLRIETDLLSLSYGAYVLFACMAVFWSLNRAEAIFESARLVMTYFTFLLGGHFLKKYGSEFIMVLQKLSLIVFFVGLGVFLYQFASVKGFKKDELYLLTGLNAHKNLYASFLFLQLYFFCTGIKDHRGFWKLLNYLSLILALLVIGVLRTKSVWTGLLAAGIVYVLLLFLKNLNFTKSRLLVSGLIMLLLMNLFFAYALPKVIDQGLNLSSAKDQKKPLLASVDEERLILWDKSYHSIRKHPLLGVGPGNWQVYFPDATLSGIWRAEDLNFTFQRPHNDFLWILSETGYIGLNLFFIFLISLHCLLLMSLRPAAETVSKNRLSLCLASICGFFVISFFDFPKERIEHLVWLGLLMAIARHYILTSGTLKSYRSFTINPPMLLLPLALSAGLVVIGYLRHRGESKTRILYDNLKSKNVSKVLSSARKAESFAYTLDPTSIPMAWYSGNAYAETGDYKNAMKELLRAREFNPYNRNVLSDLASAYVYTGETDSAKALYREAARISPRFDEPKLNMAAVLIKEGNFAEASQWLNSLMHDSERRTKYEEIVKTALQAQ